MSRKPNTLNYLSKAEIDKRPTGQNPAGYLEYINNLRSGGRLTAMADQNKSSATKQVALFGHVLSREAFPKQQSKVKAASIVKHVHVTDNNMDAEYEDESNIDELLTEASERRAVKEGKLEYLSFGFAEEIMDDDNELLRSQYKKEREDCGSNALNRKSAEFLEPLSAEPAREEAPGPRRVASRHGTKRHIEQSAANEPAATRPLEVSSRYDYPDSSEDDEPKNPKNNAMYPSINYKRNRPSYSAEYMACVHGDLPWERCAPHRFYPLRPAPARLGYTPWDDPLHMLWRETILHSNPIESRRAMARHAWFVRNRRAMNPVTLNPAWSPPLSYWGDT